MCGPFFAKLDVDNCAAMVYLCASLVKSAAKAANSDKAEAGKTSYPMPSLARKKRAASFVKA